MVWWGSRERNEATSPPKAAGKEGRCCGPARADWGPGLRQRAREDEGMFMWGVCGVFECVARKRGGVV